MAPVEKVIDIAEVIFLRNQCLSWTKIAALLHVSRSKLQKWRVEVNYDESGKELTDPELDAIVRKNVQRNRGSTYMQGVVRAAGKLVSRERVRQSMRRVDPIGIENRKRKTIVRREYTVAGPHHVWHLDGHHKLIKYGLVTHGCIDGFSRAIVYLECSDNNQSVTVHKLFKTATQQFMVPYRVRGDRGGENVLVADAMIEARGLGRGSYIGASSKHNTRIERLWRDVRSSVIEYYMQFFAELVRDGMDTESEVDMFVLHFMFKRRINEELTQFKQAWNNHSIRTEKQLTPLQLIELNLETIPPPVNAMESDDDEVEEENPEGVQHVQVNPLRCPLTPGQLEYFTSQCVSLTIDDDTSVLCDRYMNALQFCYRVLDLNI